MGDQDVAKPTLQNDAFIRSLRLRWERVADREAFPFVLPAFRSFTELSLHPQVTFFVGENGSGKSTLLEALARNARLSPQGGTRNMWLEDQAGGSPLADSLLLVRGVRRPKDAFFLRAESFFNVASFVDEVGATGSYGGRSLHHQSHGESTLALVEHRFGACGLFLLDEPEAALSPQRQLTFLAHMKRLLDQGAQFVIATHSPILLAYPGATIYWFADGIQERAYGDLEHVQVTRDFLAAPGSFLRHLLGESSD